MAKKITLKEKLRRNQQAGRGLPTKTVTVWLGVDHDLIGEYEREQAKLEETNTPQRGRRLSDGSGKAAIEARLAELREQLEQYAEPFKLRALDDRAYDRLTAQHSPRKAEDGGTHPDDRGGWNAETFPEALIRAVVVEPELDDEDWTLLLGDDEHSGQLSSGQQEMLFLEALALSRTRADVPFWHAASPKTPAS